MMSFKHMEIRKRLMAAFTVVIAIFGTVSLLIAAIMVYMVGDYNRVLDNFAFPQGDIGRAMNATSEIRSSTRAIIGYETPELKKYAKEQHEATIEEFEYYREQIRPTMVTEEGKACMEAIDRAWEAYIEADEEFVALGDTTDSEKCQQAQERMIKELAPLYKELDNAMEELMNVNVQKGNDAQARLQKLQIVIMVVIVAAITIAFHVSMKLATGIAKGIEADIEKLP